MYMYNIIPKTHFECVRLLLFVEVEVEVEEVEVAPPIRAQLNYLHTTYHGFKQYHVTTRYANHPPGAKKFEVRHRPGPLKYS
jgi:hypothetical protein